MALALAIYGNFFVKLVKMSKELFENGGVRACPLNRSQRPRLINMRLRKQGWQPIRNFLTMLLEKNSPLIRERIVRRKGMMHWFMVGETFYENQSGLEKNALIDSIIDGLAKTRINDALGSIYAHDNFARFITASDHAPEAQPRRIGLGASRL